MQISGNVAAKSRNGSGIQIDGQWYNGDARQLASVNWKDFVTIEVDGNNVVAVIDVQPAPQGGGGGYQRQQQGGYQRQGGQQRGGYQRQQQGGYQPQQRQANNNDANRQAVIVFQSSRRDALDITLRLLETGVLPMPSKAADKYDAVLAHIDLMTRRLYDEAMHVYENGAMPEQPQE